MTAKLGVREITRNFNILDGYDYVEVEDKKTHILKGMFISSDFIDDVKKLIDKKLQIKKQKKLDDMMQFVGMVKGSFGDLDAKEIKVSKKDKYDK